MDTPQAVMQALESAPAILVPLVRSVPAELLKQRPAPGKWSVHEHLCHLSLIHPLFHGRLDRMLASEDSTIEPYSPENEPEDHLLKMDFETSLARYVADRETTLGRLLALSHSQWHRRAHHPEYSEYTVLAMFRHLALHDYLHGYRIEEIAMAPR